MLHNEQQTDKENILKFPNMMLNSEKPRDPSLHSIFCVCGGGVVHFI